MTLSRTTKSFSQNQLDDTSIKVFQESSTKDGAGYGATWSLEFTVIHTWFNKTYKRLCLRTLQLDAIATAFLSNHLSWPLLKSRCFRISFRAGGPSGKLYARTYTQPTFTRGAMSRSHQHVLKCKSSVSLMLCYPLFCVIVCSISSANRTHMTKHQFDGTENEPISYLAWIVALLTTARANTALPFWSWKFYCITLVHSSLTYVQFVSSSRQSWQLLSTIFETWV